MRRLHLARATVLADVAGFGKNIVPSLRLSTRGGCLGIQPQSVKCSRENRNLRLFRKFGEPDFTFHGQQHHSVNWRTPWGVTLPHINESSSVGQSGMIKEIGWWISGWSAWRGEDSAQGQVGWEKGDETQYAKPQQDIEVLVCPGLRPLVVESVNII